MSTASRTALKEGRRLYADLQSKGLARVPAHVHALLHRAFGMAVMWGMLPNNPADSVLKPAYRAERDDCWTAEQLSTFLHGTAQDRHGSLWVFLSTTGCRIGEALALRWDAVELEAGTAAINENLQRIGNEWVTCTPKTRSGERIITLPAITVAALRRQKAVLAEVKAWTL